jgi:hypothetical protein
MSVPSVIALCLALSAKAMLFDNACLLEPFLQAHLPQLLQDEDLQKSIPNLSQAIDALTKDNGIPLRVPSMHLHSHNFACQGTCILEILKLIIN